MWNVSKVTNHYTAEVAISYTVEQGAAVNTSQFPLRAGSRTLSIGVPYVGVVYFEDIGDRPLGPSQQTWGVVISFLQRHWIFRYEGNGDLEITVNADASLGFSSPNGGTVYPIDTTTAGTIESVQFPGVFLRMNGHGVTTATGHGGGTVNCQFGPGAYQSFNISPLPDGSYTIGSRQFPNVFLRMNGHGVTGSTGHGGGTVNCQWTHGAYEKFKLHEQEDGTYTIESVQFPGVFLRMDGHGVTTPTGPGGGTVNCQFGAGPYEKFRITGLDR